MAFVFARAVASKKIVYIDDTGRQVIHSGGTRAWRTNNPGNIIRGAFAKAHGAIGDDGKNAIFPDVQTGEAAIRSLLRTDTYAPWSIHTAISEYAPPNDGNDTAAYQEFVRKRTGLDPQRSLGSLDDGEIQKVVDAIKVMEGWKAGDIIRDGQAESAAAEDTPPPLAARAYVDAWMQIAEAEAALPERERSQWRDPGENPRIIGYFKACADDPPEGDETDWCAAFVNWCLERAGFDGTHSAGSRSFARASWGRTIDEPVYGCIAVFQDLPNDSPGWKTGTGHVGFVTRHEGENLWILGGNQGDTVKVSVIRKSTPARKLYCLKLPTKN